MSNFKSVANNIIADSIRNAICIDDESVPPYHSGKKRNFYQKLYQSFQAKGCSIDIHRFSETMEWRPPANLFRNKDLLILDWELRNVDDKHLDTLPILEEAIDTSSLHFICIYTQVPEVSFNDKIVYNILAYFSGSNTEIVNNSYNDLEELLLEEIEKTSIFFDKIKPLLTSITFAKKDKKALILADINALLKEYNIDAKKVKDIMISINSNLLRAYEYLGYKLNKSVISRFKKEVKQIDDSTFSINHTIIKIFPKTVIKPDELFTCLTEALIKDKENFLTLMGLEIRNTSRDFSAFIGENIDKINELAFFHHQERVHPKQDYLDFLKDLWKEQSLSFLLSTKFKIFDVLEDYKEENNIEQKLLAFNPCNHTNQSDLAKLNYYYNILNIDRSERTLIRFGDVFKVVTSDAIYYLLCITPHCDCAHTDKINNLLFFVKGAKYSLELGLKEGDTSFNSYIKESESVICIKWSDKPFTLYIPSSKNNINMEIEDCVYLDEKIALKYLCCLKDNYAQRIANNAFGYYSLRVGIYFADFKELQ